MNKYGTSINNVYDSGAAGSYLHHSRSNSNSVRNLNNANEILQKNNNKYLRYISKPSISMNKDPFVGYDKLDHKQPYQPVQDKQ